MWTVPRTDVLVKVLGAPHRSDLVTSLFRLTEALLERGATVQVWTCADATGLTRAGLGDRKPRTWPTGRSATRPPPGWSGTLLTGSPGRISWYVCRFCSLDRGAAEQIPEVRVRPAGRFWEHVLAADKTVVLGVS